MISLSDVLKLSGIPLRNYKIHLATGKSPTPLEAYYSGAFKEWQEEQSNKNFQCDTVIGLIHLYKDQWLFAGAYKILGVKRGIKTAYLYQTELLAGQEDLIGRIVVRYKREFRASYIQGVKYGHQFEVAEIKPQKLTIQPFPGHNRVILPHHHLSTIARHEDPSWKSALSSVKGVYLIVDTTSGRMYVGSATGNSGIWQRWMAYTETGHGGNKELKRLIEKRGLRYANNFQYAILEIADFHATDEEILAREQHWKEVLLSRKKGFNRN